MAESGWQWVSGEVQRGYQVASGRGQSPYPAGTIALQTPVFQTLGIDLTPYYPGTLNVAIAPARFELRQPAWTVRQVRWTDAHPPEDFSFSRCCVRAATACYAGLVYYPHPATKRTHFQAADLLEILAPWIPGLQYGDRVDLGFNPREIALIPG